MTMPTSTAVERYQPVLSEVEQTTLLGFFAGYRGFTREAYTLDLRQFAAWCWQHGVRLFDVRRVEIECFARDLEERGRARATVARRLSTVVGFYRYAEQEGVIEHSPAVHIRRPRIDYESHVAHLELMTVVAGYVVAMVLQAPQYLFRADVDPYHLLWIADRPDLVTLGRWLQSVAGVVVMAVTSGVLALRLHRATQDRRRTMALLFSYGIVAVLVVPLSPTVVQPLLGLSTEATVALQLVLLGGVPAAFALGVLRGTFRRTGAIHDSARSSRPRCRGLRSPRRSRSRWAIQGCQSCIGCRNATSSSRPADGPSFCRPTAPTTLPCRSTSPGTGSERSSSTPSSRVAWTSCGRPPRWWRSPPIGSASPPSSPGQPGCAPSFPAAHRRSRRRRTAAPREGSPRRPPGPPAPARRRSPAGRPGRACRRVARRHAAPRHRRRGVRAS